MAKKQEPQIRSIFKVYLIRYTFPEAFSNALTISKTDVPFPVPRLYASHPARRVSFWNPIQRQSLLKVLFCECRINSFVGLFDMKVRASYATDIVFYPFRSIRKCISNTLLFNFLPQNRQCEWETKRGLVFTPLVYIWEVVYSFRLKDTRGQPFVQTYVR